MGQSNSTESKEETKLNNVKKLFDNNDDTSDILESLNITELKPKTDNTNQKKPLPLMGGFNNNYEPNESDKNNNRKRYTKYDLFRMLKELDSEFQQGGGEDDKDDDESSLNDEKSMEHIKSIILRELDALKKNKSQHLGGSGCGCDGDKTNKNKNKNKKSKKLNLKNVVVEKQQKQLYGGNVVIESGDHDDSSSTSSSDSKSGDSSSTSSSEEAGYKSKKGKKSKKSKKVKANKLNNDNSESSKFFIETSESGKKDDTSNGDEDDSSSSDSDDKKKKNGDEDKTEDTEEGLSIFPFNSSDVKSSLSVKNYRMLRRKI
jgi:hypothetical protein